MMTFF